jgi:hypothetical protein
MSKQAHQARCLIEQVMREDGTSISPQYRTKSTDTGGPGDRQGRTIDMRHRQRGRIAMHEPTLSQILQRLQQVERVNHWWKLASITASVLLGIVVLLGAAGEQGTTPMEELRAMRVILVDAEGRPRGRVGVEADGTPRLFLIDPTATPRVGLAITGDGRPGVTLYDAQGRPRAGLGMAADGRFDLGVGDAAGTIRLGLGVATDGRPGLTLYDQRGTLRAVLSLAADGRAGLSFLDEAGAVVWQAPAATPERR